MIQQVTHAQLYMPYGQSDRQELQLLVYREGCQGVSDLVSVPEKELVTFLNTRDAALASKQAPAILQKTIAVDFDGTLCEHRFPDIGEPKPFAKDALRMFRKLGYRIIIWTCRTCHWNYDVFGGDPSMHTLDRPHVQAMVAWLKENGIEYDEIDDGSRGKPLADFYIDDKAVRLDNNTTWADIMAAVALMQPPPPIPTKEKNAE